MPQTFWGSSCEHTLSSRPRTLKKTQLELLGEGTARMPWGMHHLLFLPFLVFGMAATRSTIGMSQTDPLLAPIASLEQTNFELQQTFAETSCTWCCWECLTELAATKIIIDTSMNSSTAGQDMTRNRSWLLLVPPYMHQTLCPSRSGVNMCTLNWPTICGYRGMSESSAAAHWPCTRLTSREPSRKLRPGTRPTPRRLCLGKQLRPRKLRPQAWPRPRYRRPRNKTLTWHQQVAARLNATWGSWLALLAPCAHQLQGLCRVLLLQGVVPLIQYVATRSAFTQALRSPSIRTIPTLLHGIQETSLGPHVAGPGQNNAPPAVPNRPLRFRPLWVDRTFCLHLPPSRLGFPPQPYYRLFLRSLCSATMDPLHDDVLEEALADTDAAVADTTDVHAAPADTAATTGSDNEEGAASVAVAVAKPETRDAEEDAPSEASIYSTWTAATHAADRSPSPDRRGAGAGPFGPPPAVPISHALARDYIPGLSLVRPHAHALPAGFMGFVNRRRPAPLGSSLSAQGPPTVPQMPGEPDDPHW